MFKKILATVGIGAAKVDTILQTEHLQPGQKFSAEILIQGGDVEQEISGLDLALMTKVKVEGEDGDYFTNHVIESWHIVDKCTVAAGELKSIPFEARLHSETPITELNQGLNQTQVWLATGLNIDMALDPTDKDPIYVYPNDAVRTFMQAMERCGFSLVKSDVENNLIYLRGSIPGSKNTKVFLRESVKNITKKTINEKYEAKLKKAEAKKGKK